MNKNYKKLIPITGPSITEKEVDYVAKAAKDGWNENATRYVNLFEEKFSKYVGRKFALATSSCTGALHLAYLASGLKKGDEVIVPNITWIASIEPLYYIGASPVFADIEPDTWCMDPKDIERKITKKTKAILVVDLYGHVADMRAILKIAKKYKLKVIEDAAEAVGSEYYGKKAGSFGGVSCFSFHGSKTLVTGEGGMLLTDNENIIKKARYYNDHCKDPKKLFWNLGIGYKYKMSNFQAACGLAQLERVNELVAKKRKIFSWYKKYLSKVPGVSLNVERQGTKNAYWMVTAVFDKKYKINKENLIKKLAKCNIQSRPFFYPLSSLPAIRTKVNTPVSYDVSSRAINLPCGQNITKADVGTVCSCLVKYFGV
ncbi:MAG: DegT/DnrJ/EryC1/StrS family aminotransferase [bacterium]|nr:DegT/DnrJ/EryC1/StrS family aminotransferase [bacterium]